MGKTDSLRRRRRLNVTAITAAIALVLGSALAAEPAFASAETADVVITHPSIETVGGYAVRLSFDYALNVERLGGPPAQGYVALSNDESTSFYYLDVSGNGHFSKVFTFAAVPGTYDVLYSPSIDGGPASEHGMLTGPYFFGTGKVTLPVVSPMDLAQPKLAGTAAVGNVLIASAPSSIPGTTLSYRWMRNGVVITRATLATYTLVPADLGAAITVAVTASKNGYTTVTRTSARTAAVAKGTITPGAPTLTGKLLVGSTLTANPGSWSPVPDGFTFQWARGGVAIPGAVGRTYALATGDLAKSLTVTVTGKKSGYATVAKTSAASALVRGTFTQTPVPAVSGAARVGQTLSVAVGTWSPGPTGVSYQWNRAGRAIAGATARTYLVRPTDVDASLTVSVTGTKPSYAAVTKTSAGTGKIVGVAYANCALLNAAYAHGLAKAGVTYDRVAGVNRPFKGTPYFSSAAYLLNVARDGDKDGIACEK